MSSNLNFQEIFQFIQDNKQTITSYNDDLKCLLCKQLVIDPYHTICMCIFCKTCIKEYIKNNKTCPGTSLECGRYELDYNSNIFSDTRTALKIIQIKTKCPNTSCNFIDTINNVIEHYKECIIKDKLNEDKENQLKYDNKKVDINNKKKNDLEFIIKEVNEMKKEIEKLKNDNKDTKDKLKLVLYENEELKQLQKIQDKEIQELRMEIIAEDIEIANARLCPYMWKITDLSVKRMEAKQGKNICLYSDKFFSYQNGYKLRLILYPNGDNKKDDTYLTIYLQIMRGPHDNILLWPCREIFRMDIINQQTRIPQKTRELSYASAYGDCKNCYMKPTSDYNMGHGHNLVAWVDLCNPNNKWKVDDMIFIQLSKIS